jgi:hypothetical protein
MFSMEIKPGKIKKKVSGNNVLAKLMKLNILFF